MTSSTGRGRFVWCELMTTDAKAAQEFYGKVAGWGTAPFGEDGSYSLWMNGEAPVGGCMNLSPELRTAGVPPHWTAYISAPDLDQACADVKRLGGKVRVEPQEIPGVGRFAIVADPQGAEFGLYAAAEAGPPAQAPRVGEFSWHELATTDPKAALRFYGELCGWKVLDTFDMGPMGTYHLYGLDGTMLGGIYPKPAAAPAVYWLPYIKVGSADEATTTATAAGATVIHGPIEVPGGDRITMATDPQGAMFAVHSAKA
jgi:uncharacterized protein